VGLKFNRIRRVDFTQEVRSPHAMAGFIRDSVDEPIGSVDAKTKLRGGSDRDRAEAREWISLFLNDAVVREM
jgi:hypothetical protein